MPNKLTDKQIAHKLAEYCEQLFFQNLAFKTVLIQSGDTTLVRKFSELASDAALVAEVHQKFVGLYAKIAASTNETDAWELASKIPVIPVLK